MSTVFKLPVSINDFYNLRKNNYLYVDKTAKLEKLIENDGKYFISRPNGFGKTLTLSVIDAIFSGKIDLFHGLAAEKLVKNYAKKPYPIINLDFAILNTKNLKYFEITLFETIHNIASSFEVGIKNSIISIEVHNLIESIYKKFGQVVILIDNYDQPIFGCAKNNELLFNVYETLKSFYDTLNVCNKYIKFLLITGTERYNNTCVFSTIDQINDISDNEYFSDLLGFTQEELKENFTYYIDLTADKLNTKPDILVKDLMKWIDKFSFDGKTYLYQPISLIKSIYDQNIGSYPTLIKKNTIANNIFYKCINKGDLDFLGTKKYQIYVDKSELLIYTNKFIETENRYICISRPRRFGKTISVNMVAAYYDISCDAKKTFSDLKIAKHPSFFTFANKYIVIKVNILDYLNKLHDIDLLINELKNDITNDLLKQYGTEYPSGDLNELMESIYLSTDLEFVIVIDEWDCILREFKNKKDLQKKYLDFLRLWFKDRPCIALVYMTGILPIKKYGTHSALNMFNEYSMLSADPFTEFVGFTEQEVKKLCEIYHRNFDDCKLWYDGYQIQKFSSIYNPRSVNQYISSGNLDTYWNKTETYEALKDYIFIEKYGIRNIIINLLANASVKINPSKFTNDMETFNSHDDVLTLLVHLGYLSYNASTSSVHIPNKEISSEFITAIDNEEGWPIVVQAISNSAKLLAAVLRKDSSIVAQAIQAAHLETSILQYNDENALAYTISLAFYAAREKYTIVREFPTGKGFADLVFLPKKKADYPTLLIELKWDQCADGAIKQIYDHNYPASIQDRQEQIFLVGINYDPKTKEHTCAIETFQL